MQKPAPTPWPILEVIRLRWSGRNLHPRRQVPRELLRILLEGARWAPSSYNEQPWRFLVCDRETPDSLETGKRCLHAVNAWARAAPCLIFTFTKETRDRDGRPNPYAWHDAGIATAFLVLQATAVGLLAHPMAGFERERVAAAFRVPEPFQPTTVVAVGYPASLDTAPEPVRRRELEPRWRKSLGEIAYEGIWGRPFPEAGPPTDRP